MEDYFPWTAFGVFGFLRVFASCILNSAIGPLRLDYENDVKLLQHILSKPVWSFAHDPYRFETRNFESSSEADQFPRGQFVTEDDTVNRYH